MNFIDKLFLFVLNNVSKLRRWIIGKYALGILYSTDNGLLIVGADDLGVGKALAYKGSYDNVALNQLTNLVSEQSSVCVIGAHVGSLLIPLAKKAKYVVGYEANPETFKLLNINIKLNNLNNVSIYNMAIGNKTGTIEFYANTVNSGGSKIKPKSDHYAYIYDKPDIIKVNMTSLDEHNHGKNIFDLIIMDIEGAEYLALQGMQDTLNHCKYLQIEYVPHHLENVAAITNIEFLSVFSKFFKTMTIVGQPEHVYKETEFLSILNKLQKSGKCVDLLFKK